VIRRTFRYLTLAAFLVTLFYVVVDSYAAPFEYDTTSIDWKWAEIPNAIIIDSNNDGLVDTIYTYSGTNPNYVLNKIMGTGANSISVTTATGTLRSITVSGNHIWFNVGSVSGTTCTGTGTPVNYLTGVQNSNLSTTTTHASANNPFVIAYNKTGGVPMLGMTCSDAIKVVDTATTLRTCSSSSNHQLTRSILGCDGTGRDAAGTSRTIPTTPQFGGSMITCAHDLCSVRSGANVVYMPLTGTNVPVLSRDSISTMPPFAVVDPNIQLYQWGFKLPRGALAADPNAFWHQYFTPPANDYEKTAMLHYRNLGLTESPYRFLISHNDFVYLGYFTTTGSIFVSPLTSINNSALVSHFPFDNHTFDVAGFGTGTVSGVSSYTAASGDAGFAFNGATSISIPNESEYDFERTDPFSVSFWVKDSGGSNFDVIIGKVIGFSGGTPGWAVIRAADADRRVEFNFQGTSMPWTIVSSVNSVPLNTWTHVTVTYDGSSNRSGMKIYINGILNTTGSPSVINQTILNDQKLTIGATPVGTSFFDGAVNDVRIYNTALTAGQVAAIYADTPASVEESWRYDGRAMQYYVPDTEGASLSAQTTSTSLAVHSYNILTPTATLSASISGPFSLFSGYEYVRSSTVLRAADPKWTNDDTARPLIIGPTTTLTQMNMQIRGLPHNDFAVDVKSKLTAFNGIKYSWGIDNLTADRILTIDLPTNLCVDILVRDIRIQGSQWVAIGELCATSSAVKVVTYQQNLSFTFWTLEWGTSTQYNATSEVVQTLVRNKNVPFTYNVNIVDSGGNTIHSQQFVASDLDIQPFNLTGVSKPARLIISDIENKTLHHVSIGTGNWLQDFQAFSNQHLTIDGFNLLFMMPLIFAALWTRNTVSMGTMITVVFIMTLVFVGILAIPDVLLYLMLFVAGIAMVAYKLMF
jgi:predicted nucleic-acid-binding protein